MNQGNNQSNNNSLLNNTLGNQSLRQQRNLEIKIQLDELKGFDPKLVIEMIRSG